MVEGQRILVRGERREGEGVRKRKEKVKSQNWTHDLGPVI